jgi:hypothetical protein
MALEGVFLAEVFCESRLGRLHEQRKIRSGRDQEVHVVGHQGEMMHGDAVGSTELTDRIEVVSVISLVAEERHAVIATGVDVVDASLDDAVATHGPCHIPGYLSDGWFMRKYPPMSVPNVSGTGAPARAPVEPPPYGLRKRIPLS